MFRVSSRLSNNTAAQAVQSVRALSNQTGLTAMVGSANVARMRAMTGFLAQSASYSSVPRQMTQQMTLKEVGIMGMSVQIYYLNSSAQLWKQSQYRIPRHEREQQDTNFELFNEIDPYVIPEKESRPSIFNDYKTWIKYAKLRMRNTGMTAAR